MPEHRGDPASPISLPSVPNLRDVGGCRTTDGRTVRRGLVYRSTELSKLHSADLAGFAALGLRAVYDLRTGAERGAQPDRLPDGVEYVVADVLGDLPGLNPAQLLQLLDDPRAAAEAFGGSRATTIFQTGYRAIVSLPSARSAYARLYGDLASGGSHPLLFHCTTGKDRTGWGAAALLLLLGVAPDDVMADFLLSTRYLLAAFAPVLERFRELGGDPDLLIPVIGVRPEYLETALDEMSQRFGTVEGYFAVGLGLDETRQGALREALLGPA